MNVLRRLTVGVLAMAVMLCVAAQAGAQVLKQIPADPFVVIKIKSPQDLSAKAGAMAQKLGLANIDPNFADPLGALKKQFNLQQGFDGKGEAAMAIYDSPQPGEPRAIILLPVTDFKAFMGNLANVKDEGGISSFTMPDDPNTLYAANWGSYAAITPTKDMLAQKPAGVEVAGLAAKQLESNDIIVYANMKAISAKVLPMLKDQRNFITGQMDQELQNNKQFNQKFTPVLKTLVGQALNGAEAFLTDCQAATYGITLSPKGINTTVMAEFTPQSYCGQAVSGIKNTDGSLTKGLPSRKYFAFGGAVADPATTSKLLNDIMNPITRDLAAAGDDAKPILSTIEAMKTSLSSMTGLTFGYAQPTAPNQSMIQAVGVVTGDAKKIADAAKANLAASADFMKMMQIGQKVDVRMNQGTKTVGGVTLDTVQYNMAFDQTTPEGAQAQQMITMMYGPNGLNVSMGAVSPTTFVQLMGADDELVNAAVASAKSQDDALSQLAHIKGVSAELPQNRAAVYYIAVDNIATTVLDVMGRMGMRMPLRLPADMPPIGVTFGSEGSAVRIDSHVSTELIEKLVSLGFQGAMMMQGGGQRRPGGGI